MLHERLVSALKKAGATVEDISTPKAGPFHRRFKATLGKKTIEWRTQENYTRPAKGSWACEPDGRLFTGTVTMRHPDTDVYRDYNADSYVDTIKEAVKMLTGN